MLVLARRINERILIPCIQAAIQVVGIQGGNVRLGIEAPTDVQILREEVCREEQSAKAARPVPARSELARQLTDAAHELSMVRRQLRGKLPASAAAALFRIDRDLADIARNIDRATDEGKDTGPGTTLTVPVAP